jgi:hypothetical protein
MRKYIDKTITYLIRCPERECAYFATPVGKETVTKSHKPSLNCLFAHERQLFATRDWYVGFVAFGYPRISPMTRGQCKSRRPGVVFEFHTMRGHMKFSSKALLAAAGLTALAFTPAYATEGGDQATKPGAFIGSMPDHVIT